jgi:hypothetical protein
VSSAVSESFATREECEADIEREAEEFGWVELKEA